MQTKNENLYLKDVLLIINVRQTFVITHQKKNSVINKNRKSIKTEMRTKEKEPSEWMDIII